MQSNFMRWQSDLNTMFVDSPFVVIRVGFTDRQIVKQLCLCMLSLDPIVGMLFSFVQKDFRVTHSSIDCFFVGHVIDCFLPHANANES